MVDGLERCRNQGRNMRVRTSTASGRAVILSTLGVLIAWYALLMTASSARSRWSPTSRLSAVSIRERTDRELRDQLIGTWHRAFFGEQRIRLESGGRATLVVEPNLVWSFLFGKRLQVQIAWELKGNHVIYQFLGGTPENKVRLAQEMFGEYWDQTILELTETRLVLTADEGYGNDVWQRDLPPAE